MKRFIAVAFIVVTCIVPWPINIAAMDGLVKISVASLRSAPAHSAELETQALMGTPVTITEVEGEWRGVIMPNGYKAYIPESSIMVLSPEEMAHWRRAKRYIVTAWRPGYITSKPAEANGDNIVSDIVFGCILEASGDYAGDGWVGVATPDNRKGWVKSTDVAPLKEGLNPRNQVLALLNYAYSLIGTPYLWGGNSSKFVDCSGLTSLCYMMAGIMLPRNASQQAQVGIELNKEDPITFAPGDLVFFSDPENSDKVTHVGIAVGEGNVIHASGQVKLNSLLPDSSDFIGRTIHSVRRIIGSPDAFTSTFSRSPFYF